MHSQGSPYFGYVAPPGDQVTFSRKRERVPNLKKVAKMDVFGDFLSISPNKPNF